MLENLLSNGIIDTNDEGLRQYIHDRLKVFATFTSNNCPICELLAPGFEHLADEEQYQGILFVRLDFAENPVAKLLMNKRGAPFFVSYCQGRMLECDTRETEAAMLAQLNRLRVLMPVSA
ncbi:hypothetical protein GCM10022409_02910 [Hymenobacter glaciei]|uniref:Thioredoxin domain-containing protein n=1 Tax=Hymenobacter glaciei TaxID=877209 RepID=A0ABP7T985_9BACT